MAEERPDEPQPKTAHDLLKDWREAERDADEESPGSAGEEMARHRSQLAREAFHDREDDEREQGGDARPRKSVPS